MKYTIVSLNDDRLNYKKNLRACTSMEEIVYPAVDGRNVDVPVEYKKRGLWPYGWSPTAGEAGIWLSNFDRWHLVSEMQEPLVVFEDDAIIYPDFDSRLYQLMDELLEYNSELDYAALWVPDNQRIDFLYNVEYNEIGDPVGVGPNHTDETSQFRINERNIGALAYQGYGMVSLIYTPQGGKKLIELAQKTGIYTPVDCWIFQQTQLGNLRGYAPHPNNVFVHYDWKAQTQVHNSDRIVF